MKTMRVLRLFWEAKTSQGSSTYLYGDMGIHYRCLGYIIWLVDLCEWFSDVLILVSDDVEWRNKIYGVKLTELEVAVVGS